MSNSENILTAKEGFVLTNGETYGRKIYLSVNDKAENWREVPEEEILDSVDEKYIL